MRSAAGEVVVGRSLPGRGAWLCAGSPACVDLAERRSAFSRALRAPVSPDAISTLRITMSGAAGPPGTQGPVGCKRARMESRRTARRKD
ncbi:MAG: YlxR family protein [Actinomycetota bacterium]|nr:YlxR family protein [Actinomycetota bacterium]